jgi:hypothetical protein
MATLVIACPICLQKIRAPANVVGRQIRCPQCKNGFTAADPSTVPTEAALPRAPRSPEPEPVVADPLGLDSDSVAAEVAAPQGNAVVDFFLLRRMITPVILTTLFWFGVALMLLAGLVGAIVVIIGMVTHTTSVGPGLLMLLLDFVTTICVLILWRVVCETIATVFRIAERVKEVMDRNLK